MQTLGRLFTGILVFRWLAVSASVAAITAVSYTHADTPIPAPPWEQVQFTFASHSLWNQFGNVELSGDYAYVAIKTGLLVFDISSPSTPNLKSQLYLPEGNAKSVSINEDKVYLCAFGPNNTVTLYEIDTSDPTTPMVAIQGSWSSPNSLRTAILHGRRAYVLDGAGLDILDISDLTNINLLGNLAVGAENQVLVSGNTAFITGSGPLKIADITDPANCAVIAQFKLSEVTPHHLDISADSSVLYFTNRSDFIDFAPPNQNPEEIAPTAALLDISNRTNPSEIGRVQLDESWTRDIDAQGSVIYVSDGACGIKIVDISNLSQPELIGSYQPPSEAATASVRDSLLCFIDAPTISGVNFSCPGAGYQNGPYVGDLILLNVAVPFQPTLKGFYSAVGPITNVAIRNNILLVPNEYQETRMAGSASDLTIVNVSDKAAPQIMGRYLRPGRYCNAAFVSDSVVLLSVGAKGMDILNIADPQHPLQIANLPASIFPGSVEVKYVCAENDYAFLVQTNGVRIVNISNLASPQVIDTIKMTQLPVSVDVQWPYLYAAGGGRLTVFDVTNPNEPEELIYKNGNYNEVHAMGNRLYVAGERGFGIFDISNPALPESLFYYDAATNCHGVTVDGNHLYLTNDREGISVFDVSNPPVVLASGSYNTPGSPQKPVVNGEYLFIPDYDGLVILGFDVATDIPEPHEPELPADFILHQNYPNPFNAGTVISFELKRKARCALSVYDILGRKVKTLVDESKSPGAYRVNWDGTNTDNKQVASGTYFYRLDAGGTQISKKMVLVR